jgi:hypothetical protein
LRSADGKCGAAAVVSVGIEVWTRGPRPAGTGRDSNGEARRSLVEVTSSPVAGPGEKQGSSRAVKMVGLVERPPNWLAVLSEEEVASAGAGLTPVVDRSRFL